MKDSNWFGKGSELEHSGGESHLILEILHTNKALLATFSKGTGIPMSQLVLMRILAGAGNYGVGVLDIARIVGINGAAVTRPDALAELERYAFAHPGRAIVARLGGGGAEAIARALKAEAGVGRMLVKDLSASGGTAGQRTGRAPDAP